MIGKLLLVGVVLFLLVGGVAVSITHNNNSNKDGDNMETVYQGPVPQGYDLEHFRNTGETILEVKD